MSFHHFIDSRIPTMEKAKPAIADYIVDKTGCHFLAKSLVNRVVNNLKSAQDLLDQWPENSVEIIVRFADEEIEKHMSTLDQENKIDYDYDDCDQDSLLAKFDTAQLWTLLDRAIEDLSAKEHNAFIYKHYYDYEPAQIANWILLPEKAVLELQQTALEKIIAFCKAEGGTKFMSINNEIEEYKRSFYKLA